RYATCEQCEEESDVTLDKEGLCNYHEGMTPHKVNRNNFQKANTCPQDEDTHGRIDTNANRGHYPEGFIWLCCDATGDEPRRETG
ncbi:hypothetical protein K432DRAFT_296156, partial [Lepidopterella palustris CBS 459.81]